MAVLIRADQRLRDRTGRYGSVFSRLSINWATCDLLTSPYDEKAPRHTHPGGLSLRMESDKPYTIRFRRIRMLDARVTWTKDLIRSIRRMVAAIRSEEYYVNMMRAWYFATALAKQYEKILPFLEEQRMDIWTHNKTIQKSIESYRITQEQKDHLRTLRIKK